MSTIARLDGRTAGFEAVTVTEAGVGTDAKGNDEGGREAAGERTGNCGHGEKLPGAGIA